MYPNPFDRKHSTIRQVLDRLLRGDARQSLRRDKALPRNRSDVSWSSCSSSGTGRGFKPGPLVQGTR